MSTSYKQLLRLSMPVMAALLIQAAYNIVDSFFIARYSQEGLTALSIIFPIQLLMTALATGTGVGANTLVSRAFGSNQTGKMNDLVKTSMLLGVLNYLIFSVFGWLILNPFFYMSSDTTSVIDQGVRYGRLIILCSFGIFVESICTKLLQAKNDMTTPMKAQITGAFINIVLDPILIFGLGGIPAMGITGAAIATIVGQAAAMFITLYYVAKAYDLHGHFSLCQAASIYKSGFPSIVMQSLYTVYIVGLNILLKGFTEDAVTVLGIYYKLQSFFFIPLFGFQQVMIPVMSYYYGAGQTSAIYDAFKKAIWMSALFMSIGSILFICVPGLLIGCFSDSAATVSIGVTAFRIIGFSFIPSVTGLMFCVFFQATDCGFSSLMLTVIRQIVLLVPLAWLFGQFGLNYVWFTFPVTEVITGLTGVILYKKAKLKIEHCIRT